MNEHWMLSRLDGLYQHLDHLPSDAPLTRDQLAEMAYGPLDWVNPWQEHRFPWIGWVAETSEYYDSAHALDARTGRTGCGLRLDPREVDHLTVIESLSMRGDDLRHHLLCSKCRKAVKALHRTGDATFANKSGPSGLNRRVPGADGVWLADEIIRGLSPVTSTEVLGEARARLGLAAAPFDRLVRPADMNLARELMPWTFARMLTDCGFRPEYPLRPSGDYSAMAAEGDCHLTIPRSYVDGMHEWFTRKQRLRTRTGRESISAPSLPIRAMGFGSRDGVITTTTSTDRAAYLDELAARGVWFAIAPDLADGTSYLYVSDTRGAAAAAQSARAGRGAAPIALLPAPKLVRKNTTRDAFGRRRIHSFIAWFDARASETDPVRR